jgi:hypothetical protein
MMAGTPFSTSFTVADDVGDGTTGSLTVKITGTAAAGMYWAIPVTGGGSVLGYVVTTSVDPSLTITASGEGGDVGLIGFDAGAKSLKIGGVADTDVAVIYADGDVGSLVNTTVGGDFAIIDVVADGDDGSVGLIQTGKMGVLGSVFSGTDELAPAFVYTDYDESYGTIVEGEIGKIQVGSIFGTEVYSEDSIGSVSVKGGMITDSYVGAKYDIGSVSATGMLGSTISAGENLGKVSIGSGGVLYSTIEGLEGITSVAVKGVIESSTISAYYNAGGHYIGGPIGSVSADAMIESEILAVGAVGKLTVKGAMWDSQIRTAFWDGTLPTPAYVGGAVTSVSVAGMYDSKIEGLGTTGSIKVGKGGMLYDSEIDIQEGDLNSMMVSGDVNDSDISVNDGLLKSLKISGDVAYSSEIEADYLGSLTIGRMLYDSDISVDYDATTVTLGGFFGDSEFSADDVGSFTIKGATAGEGNTQVDVGDIGSMSFGGSTYYINIEADSIGKLAFKKDAAYLDIDVANDLGSLTSKAFMSTDIHVYGDLGSMKTADLHYVDLIVYGEAGAISVGGDILESDIELRGATAKGLTVKGDSFDSDIQVGVSGGTATDAKQISIGGSAVYTDIELYGPLASLSVKGSFIDSDVDGDAALGKLAIGKSVIDADIDTSSTVDSVSIGGDLYYSYIEFDSGIGNVAVKGNIMDSDILAENYDGSGDPIASNIGNITATKIYESEIGATGSIGLITAKTLIGESEIWAVGRENYGSGSAVSGGSIAGVKAAGLFNADFESWGDMGKFTLGSYGVDAGSDIEVLDSAGSFAGLSTKGFILGDIWLAGDLAGSITSAGTDAFQYEGIYYFLDGNGSIAGGRLDVNGTIGAGVVIS